ncbi:hypothetical protein KSF_109240 [Reticulibacter mediterranei]|uniref:DUF2332 domain-containing protein n=1 Tax=Reticulibacter mediterranei TaxID=2778369 RepID=A0A8J3J3H5_9CHLR|nr:DUF2332 domain-containing protein [Reticulibacter mediterranei]GHP00877.1 hypothetical protein KSF_109240 [Reticulibacter mediterranei]
MSKNRELTEQFRLLVERAYSTSTVYRALCSALYQDEVLLSWLAQIAAPPQKKTALLLAGVQWLLTTSDTRHPLADWYQASTAGWSPESVTEERSLYRHFRAFCDQHWQQLIHLMRTREIQYSDPGRAALLLPALTVAASWIGEPLSLIEAGAGAGFNLLFDRYAYLYVQRDQIWHYSSVSTALDLSCTVTGRPLLFSPGGLLPSVQSRLGIDLAPLAFEDEQDRAWIMAFLPPDDPGLRLRVQTAIEVARADAIPMVAGDALALLPDLLGSERHGVSTLFFSFVLWQWSPTQRAQLHALLTSYRRPLAVLILDRSPCKHSEVAPVQLTVTLYHHGKPQQTTHLATCHPNGSWMLWHGEEREEYDPHTTAQAGQSC